MTAPESATPALRASAANRSAASEGAEVHSRRVAAALRRGRGLEAHTGAQREVSVRCARAVAMVARRGSRALRRVTTCV